MLDPMVINALPRPAGFTAWVRYVEIAHEVVALGAPDILPPAVPLLQERGLVDGRAATCVCNAPHPKCAFACQAPMTTVESFRAQLERC